MHSIEELGTNIPAFLAKLWRIVENPETNDLICWNPSGTSFLIRNQSCFARELLPLYYKHNNMASFVRQLNMYGFHKVASIEGGGLKADNDEMEFTHQCFLMGYPSLLEHIKRKISTSKMEADGLNEDKPEMAKKVLSDIKSMKGRQDNVDSQLSSMKRENEVLWREIAILRQKHIKQQQIVNKLIQFLVTMVQSSRSSGIGIKRHYPLMINDIGHRPSKVTKLGGDVTDRNTGPNTLSLTGPVIHEIEPTNLLEECNTSTVEDTCPFLSTHLCEVVIDEVPSSTSNCSLGLVEGATTIPNNPTPEVLLQLVEEWPLVPDTLDSTPPLLMSQDVPKARTKGAKEIPKKRKYKRGGKGTARLAVKAATKLKVSPNATEDSELSGQDHLNPVLTLEGKDLFLAGVSPYQIEDLEVDIDENSSLEAATKAVISTLNGGAAGSKDLNTLTLPNEEELKPHTSNMTLACANTNLLDNRCGLPDDLDQHIDSMQAELEGLKDLFKSEGYSLDANTLLGVCPSILSHDQDLLYKLFNEDPMYGISMIPEEEPEVKPSNSAGNELMTYSSNLMDLADMFGSSDVGDWNPPSTPSNNGDISLSELNTPQIALSSPNFPASTSMKRK